MAVQSVRNNNPGNMRSKTGAFQQFASPDLGLKAMRDDLLLKVMGQSPAMRARFGAEYQPTLRNLITTWAPPEENDTENYIKFVSNSTGIDPESPLSRMDVEKLIPAMTQMEGGKEASIHFGTPVQYASTDNVMTDAVIDNGPAFDRASLLAEAQRRGLQLDAAPQFDRNALLVEAKRRGLSVEDGFLTRVREDVIQRGAEARDAFRAYKEGEQTLPETVLQAYGKAGGGTILDVLGEAATSGFRVLPDVVQDPLRDVGAYIGEQIQPLAEEYANWAKEHPRAARNIESAADIAMVAAPVKPGKVKVGEGAAARAGKKLIQAGEKQALKERSEFALDLIRPKQTAAQREAQVGNTVERGLLKTKVVEATAKDNEIAEQLANLAIGKKHTLQGNYNIIAGEAEKEAIRLKNRLAANDVAFPRKEYFARLNAVMQGFEKNPALVGDAGKSAERIIQKMQEIVQSKPSKASSLLEARKELDRWVKSQKGDAVFDPAKDNAMSIALREVRNATNSFIDEKAVDVGVKASLRKQSNLYTAMDSIAPKAADEASNVVARAWQNINKVIPINNEMGRNITIALGIGGIGASGLAPGAAQLATAGFLSYKGYQLAASPGAKKALGQLLVQTDRAIRVSKDKQLIRQLRADRAAIKEMLGDLPQDDSEGKMNP